MMAGSNPYLQDSPADPPTGTYTLTFEPMQVEVQVNPQDLPEGGEGLLGSILSIAHANGIEIDHACGGVCACSTCHVIVRSGGDSCPEPSETEEDMLDQAPGVELGSRLACQAVPNGTCDVRVEIPDWNRNHAQEGA